MLYCGTHGLLREVPIEQVAEFERMLIETLSPEVFRGAAARRDLTRRSEPGLRRLPDG
ncbi:hypothetical protein LEA_10169 [human gut metagenome]|uniref:Uncharacterized protein n=1 Tax=human gut metagenome TaxID=408170 RepID=K1THA5_9ZZZZ